MTTTSDPLPEDTDALKAALIETRAKLVGAQALIEHLQLVIDKMKRDSVRAPNAASGSLINWNCSWKSWSRRRERMRRRPGRRASSAGLHAAAGDAAQLSRRSATSAHRSPGADRVSMLRQQQTLQDRRGHHQDARRRPAAMVRDRACAGEVQLPILRDDHTAAGTVPRDRTRLCWAEPAGDDPGCQIRQSPAAQPTERSICM